MDKTKLSILICDDDEEFIQVLQDQITEFFSNDFEISLHTYSKSRDVLHNMIKYDFAFLDIDMPIISGFDLSCIVSNFNCDVKIVFVSSKNELVYESFKFKVYDFIRKDNLDEFSIKSKLWINDILPKKYKYYYLGRAIEINLKSIILVYKNVNDIYIVTPSETLKERMKISEMFEILNTIERCFIKPHRSIIINLYHVIDIMKNEIFISNGERILIPKLSRKQIKTEIMEFKSRGKRC